MDFRVGIEQAECELENARADLARATRRFEEAAWKLGGLIGVYHGAAALDNGSQDKASPGDAIRKQPQEETYERRRAPKGEARRRAEGMLNDVWPNGLTKDQVLQRAADEERPIPEGTLRHALAQLAHSGRARAKDDLWFAVRDDTGADMETAGAGQSNPAASSSHHVQEDSHEAALDDMMN